MSWLSGQPTSLHQTILDVVCKYLDRFSCSGLVKIRVGAKSWQDTNFPEYGRLSNCRRRDVDYPIAILRQQHYLRLVGPSLHGVAARATSRKPDTPAALYLYESIVAPNAYVVAGFQENVMPPNYGQRLSEQQLADLVAFLMSQ